MEKDFFLKLPFESLFDAPTDLMRLSLLYFTLLSLRWKPPMFKGFLNSGTSSFSSTFYNGVLLNSSS